MGLGSRVDFGLECGGGEGRPPVAEGRAAELVDDILGHVGAARQVEAGGWVVVGAGQRHDDVPA